MSVRSPSSASNGKPTVKIIALGGTMTGVGAGPLDSHDYEPGKRPFITVFDRIRSELDKIANIIVEELENLGSPDLTFKKLVNLARHANRAHRDGATGVVYCVGTDAMEEMVWLLDLLVKIPTAVAGGMRPDSAEGRDGLHNTACAVRLVIDPRAEGAMLVSNDLFFSAWNVAKLNVNSTNAFGTGGRGEVGSFLNSVPRFHRFKRAFDLGRLLPGDLEGTADMDAKQIPEVRILYGHTDASPELIDEAAAAGVSGLVLAGLGAGNWPTDFGKAIDRVNEVREKKIVVVASCEGEGYVENGMYGLGEGCIAAGGLSPKKSRILLVCCLLLKYSDEDTRKMFDPEHAGPGPECSSACRCSRNRKRP